MDKREFEGRAYNRGSRILFERRGKSESDFAGDGNFKVLSRSAECACMCIGFERTREGKGEGVSTCTDGNEGTLARSTKVATVGS